MLFRSAVNADFWSQVLQARTLRSQDFALGAVMATRRAQLAELGGFRALVDFLADDYQLGNQLARRGYCIELCPVVVECWERPQGWREVWAHQLRWARTVRVCQPAPYFLSILSNATVWPILLFVSVAVDLRELTTRYCGHMESGFKSPYATLIVVSGLMLPFFAVVLRIGMARDAIKWISKDSV